MRQAPPVVTTLSEPLIWRALTSGLPALALGVLVYWAGRILEAPSEMVLAGALSAAMILAGVVWQRARQGPRVLVWDGSTWALDGEQGDLRLMLDIGVGMLVAFTPGEQRSVTWLAIGDAGRPRHSLRVALHAARRPDRPAIMAGADREL